MGRADDALTWADEWLLEVGVAGTGRAQAGVATVEHPAQRPRMAKWCGSIENPSLAFTVRAKPWNSSSAPSIVAPQLSQMK